MLRAYRPSFLEIRGVSRRFLGGGGLQRAWHLPCLQETDAPWQFALQEISSGK